MTNDSRITDVTDMSTFWRPAADARGRQPRFVASHCSTYLLPPDAHTPIGLLIEAKSDITSCILVYLDTDRALESAARSCTCMAFAFVASASLPKAFSPSCS